MNETELTRLASIVKQGESLQFRRKRLVELSMFLSRMMSSATHSNNQHPGLAIMIEVGRDKNEIITIDRGNSSGGTRVASSGLDVKQLAGQFKKFVTDQIRNIDDQFDALTPDP